MSNPEDLEQRVSALEKRVGMEAGLRAIVDKDLSDTNLRLDAHKRLLKAIRADQIEHERTLSQHTALLNQQTNTLNLHTRSLNAHASMLSEIDSKLGQQDARLDQQGTKLDQHTAKLDQIDAELDRLIDAAK